MFGFVEAALLRPLPYAEPDRLVDVTEATPQIPRSNLSYQDFRDWQAMNTVFSSLDVYRQRGTCWRRRAAPLMVPGMQVSDGFFRTLGVRPILGRDFSAAEDPAAKAPRSRSSRIGPGRSASAAIGRSSAAASR